MPTLLQQDERGHEPIRGMPVPETDPYGQMLARNRGRDDMAFRSKLDPIGPREPNRERMFNAEVT